MNDEEIVVAAKDLFKRADSFEADSRREELDDIDFCSLKQWPANIRMIREGDPSGSRPCLTVDQTSQYIRSVINAIRQNRSSVKVRPVDSGADVKTADVFQAVIRNIESLSNADVAYDTAAAQAVISGQGFFRVRAEYRDNSFEQTLVIDRIVNRFSVYMDPNATAPDGSDMRECVISSIVSRKLLTKQYPKYEAEFSSWQGGAGDDNWKIGQDELRIAEYYWIETEDEELYLLEDGTTAWAKDYDGSKGEPIDTRNAPKDTVKWAKIVGFTVLEKTDIPCKYIPIVQVIGRESFYDGKRHLCGMTRSVKDAQRLYNYQRSTIVESLGLTVKAPYVGATGQFKTHGKKWATANVNNFAYLEYDPITVDGTMVGAPQRQSFAGIPSGLLQDCETAKQDIQAALGMYEASLGQDGQAKSGRAMENQRQAGEIANYEFSDNLARSITFCGRILIDMIPKVMDTPQIIRILGEDGSVDHAEIDPEQPEAMKKVEGEDGAIKTIYNLGVGTYDVIADVGKSYSTRRQAGADFMTTVVQNSPDMMPIIGDLLFKSQDFPGAEDIAERMAKGIPEQFKDKPTDEASPEVQQLQQQLEQLQAQLQAAEAAMQEAQGEYAESVADKTLEFDKLEISKFEAETKRMVAMADIALKTEQQNVDGRLSSVEEALFHLAQIGIQGINGEPIGLIPPAPPEMPEQQKEPEGQAMPEGQALQQEMPQQQF